MVLEQQEVRNQIKRVMTIFSASECHLRPHFILTGPSGSGKSFLVNALAEELDINYFEINAAQLTKEGLSGNSLSKALGPLLNYSGLPTICFVDEFDKLFVAGNDNSSCAADGTSDVQNEFLKILESPTTQVFGDYGKYVNASTSNVLFIFAGAFNGEPDMTIDKLRDFGVKTEFLGRTGLIFNTIKPSLESLIRLLHKSALLDMYLKLFTKVDRDTVISDIEAYITQTYEKNTLGVRAINTLVHKRFIDGKLTPDTVSTVTFSKTLDI